MSTTSQAFGLRPAYSPMGIIRPVAMTIASGYGYNILQFQPVMIDTDGTIIKAVGTNTNSFVGTFMGVEFTDTDGRRRVSNKWTASTSATDIVAYVTTDPTIVYEIQSNATLTVANIGEQADFANVTSGSTTTGLSTATLDVASLSTSGSRNMRIVNIAPEISNSAGDPYVIVQVQISEHQFVANKVAF
jgi:hypothetical protein